MQQTIDEILEELAQQEFLMIGDVPIAQRWLRSKLEAMYLEGRKDAVEYIEKFAPEFIDADGNHHYHEANPVILEEACKIKAL